jgi:hypothetical protein
MSTEEEILSGGLHHIVTTQGTQPLTQEQPPVVLQEIIRTTSQGQEIPTNILPVMAHIQEQQANITIMAPAPSPRNGEGGNLLGTPPPVFTGDRTKAQAFLDAIAVWRAVNVTTYFFFSLLLTQQTHVTVYHYFLTRSCDSLVQIRTDESLLYI